MYIPSPETEACWRRVIQTYNRVFDIDLRAVVAHGSAIKGDFIPDWSDLDMSTFLSPDTFGPCDLPLNKTLATQATVNRFCVPQADFAYYQTYFHNTDAPPNPWVGFFPNTYRLLHGELSAGALATEASTLPSSERHFLRQSFQIPCDLGSDRDETAEMKDAHIHGLHSRDKP